MRYGVLYAALRLLLPPEGGVVNLKALAEALGVHPRTLRRGLRALEAQGLLQREVVYSRHGDPDGLRLVPAPTPVAVCQGGEGDAHPTPGTRCQGGEDTLYPTPGQSVREVGAVCAPPPTPPSPPSALPLPPQTPLTPPTFPHSHPNPTTPYSPPPPHGADLGERAHTREAVVGGEAFGEGQTPPVRGERGFGALEAFPAAREANHMDPEEARAWAAAARPERIPPPAHTEAGAAAVRALRDAGLWERVAALRRHARDWRAWQDWLHGPIAREFGRLGAREFVAAVREALEGLASRPDLARPLIWLERQLQRRPTPVRVAQEAVEDDPMRALVDAIIAGDEAALAEAIARMPLDA